MQIISPFLNYIPHCKSKMRKLRKKIYKFTNSKHYAKQIKVQPCSDICNILKFRDTPEMLIESLKKKKGYDLTAIKNIIVSNTFTLDDMMSIVKRQETEVENMMKEQGFLNSKQKKQQLSIKREMLRNHEFDSKRTFSSTQIDYELQCKSSDSSQNGIFQEENSEQYGDSSNNIENYGLFTMRKQFFEMESSIMSQEALFKF